MTDPRTPTSDPVAPQTEAGRRMMQRLAVGDGSSPYAKSARDDILAIEAEARQQARAAFAAQVATGIDAELAGITEPVGPFESGAAAAYHWVLALLAASLEPASPEAPGSGLREALVEELYGLGGMDEPGETLVRVEEAVAALNSRWSIEHRHDELEPASPGSGLAEAFLDGVRIPDSNPVAQTPYGRGFNAAAQIIRDRLAARPDGALEAFPERVEVITAHRAVSHSTQRFRAALAASPEPASPEAPEAPGSGLREALQAIVDIGTSSWPSTSAERKARAIALDALNAARPDGAEADAS